MFTDDEKTPGFSDVELKRLKELYPVDYVFGFRGDISLHALLARLEAAERYCMAWEQWDHAFDVDENVGFSLSGELQSSMQAWRKAAGRDLK